MSKKSIFILVFTALFLMGCGISDVFKKEAGEQLTESIIEQQTGDNVDIEIDEEGKTFSYENKEQGSSLSFKQDNTIPEDFPEEVYLPSWAQLESVAESTTTENGLTRKTTSLSFTTTSTPSSLESIKTEIEKALKEGWKVTITQINQSLYISAQKSGKDPDKKDTVTYTYSPDTSTLNVLVSYTK